MRVRLGYSCVPCKWWCSLERGACSVARRLRLSLGYCRCSSMAECRRGRSGGVERWKGRGGGGGVGGRGGGGGWGGGGGEGGVGGGGVVGGVWGGGCVVGGEGVHGSLAGFSS